MSARCDPSRVSHTTKLPNPKTKQCGKARAKQGKTKTTTQTETGQNVPKDLRFSMDINSDVPGFLVGKKESWGDEVDGPAAAKGDGL
jgi:hypothetical protein